MLQASHTPSKWTGYIGGFDIYHEFLFVFVLA